jgi:type I restriction enzyme, S subunit
MEQYEKYKDSGVEWIGEIPEGWEVGLLKRYCNVTDGSHFSPKSQLTGRPYVSVKDVGVNYINLDNCNKISEDDFVSLMNNGCSPKVGDVLLTKDGTIGRAAVVTEEYKQFVVLSSLGILSPRNKVCSNFLYLYLISGTNIDQMYSTIHGSALTRLTIDKINNLIFVCPSKPDQTAIANYLDRKTAEIDELIAQKERLIELYEEEKSAIINQAVTKGIDPDVRLKDSGVDWLGEIPEGWEVKKLKYLVEDIITGKTPPSSNAKFYNGDVNWFAPGDFNAEIELFDSKKKITDYAVEASGMKIFPEHTILLVGIGATVGKMGITKCTGTSNQQINAIIVKEDIINPHFALYFLLSFKTAIIRLANAATLPIFNQSQTKSFEIFIPDIDKQIAIVHHIETETARIDVKIAKTKKIIELQKEYRTALISEVVTGKIKVAA